MKCPVCKDSVLSMSERNGIEIDFCPDCRGVWLDRGELDKIIEKSAASAQTDLQSKNMTLEPNGKQEAYGKQEPYGKQDRYAENDQHYKYKYKRKKSFLEELFD